MSCRRNFCNDNINLHRRGGCSPPSKGRWVDKGETVGFTLMLTTPQRRGAGSRVEPQSEALGRRRLFLSQSLSLVKKGLGFIPKKQLKNIIRKSFIKTSH